MSRAATFQAVIGRTDITKKDEGDQVAVKKIIVHEEFDTAGTWEYDFALLILARPTTASNAQIMELNTVCCIDRFVICLIKKIAM